MTSEKEHREDLTRTARKALRAFGIEVGPDPILDKPLSGTFAEQDALVARMNLCFKGLSYERRLSILIGWLGLDRLRHMVEFLEGSE